MTWNPDAVLQSGSAGNEYAFWSRFLIGETSRVLLNVGTDAGNKFLFKLPAIQFTGIAEGDRDSVVVYDTTSTATGGEYGSSVAQIWTDESTLAGGALSAKMGVDNEFVLYAL